MRVVKYRWQTGFGVIVCALVLALSITTPSHARMRYLSLFELAQKCDVVFTGDVTEVTEDRAVVSVNSVLYGELSADSVSVTPVKVKQCVSFNINFIAGEHILLFGKLEDENRVTVVFGGGGKVAFKADEAETLLAAVERLLVIAKMEDTHQQSLAMMDEAASENAVLRREAVLYVGYRMKIGDVTDEQVATAYRERLAALLDRGDAEAQAAALRALKDATMPALLPRMIELTEEGSLAAAAAIAKYDTLESVAALIAMAGSTDEPRRGRAAACLAMSRRPEAKDVLIRLIEDKEASVRAAVASGLAPRMWSREVDEFIPKLVALSRGPYPDVRAAAVDALGWCRDPSVIPALIAAMKHPKAEARLLSSGMRGLNRHYYGNGPQARALIDRELDFIIDHAKAGRSGVSFSLPILAWNGSEKAISALQWIVEAHPNKHRRRQAQIVLNTRKKIQD